MGNTHLIDEYAKLDDRGRLVLKQRHLELLGVKAEEYVHIWFLEKERAIAIERPIAKEKS